MYFKNFYGKSENKVRKFEKICSNKKTLNFCREKNKDYSQGNHVQIFEKKTNPRFGLWSSENPSKQKTLIFGK